MTVEESKRNATEGSGNGSALDQFAWVREAIDGLRHSQNIAVSVLGGATALLAAVFAGFMIWQAGEIKGLTEKIDKSQETILAKIESSVGNSEAKTAVRIDGLNANIIDMRERIIRLEERTNGIAAQLSKFQRGSLDPNFSVETDPVEPTKNLMIDPIKPPMPDLTYPSLISRNNFLVIDKDGNKIILNSESFSEPLQIKKVEGNKYLVNTKSHGDVWIHRVQIDLGQSPCDIVTSDRGGHAIARMGASGSGEFEPCLDERRIEPSPKILNK